MKYSILVVDDEESIRELLRDFLESIGYSVDAAKDGIDALEVLEKKEYSLILSDINMPRMKGFELLAEVRAKYPKTKRALITAYNVSDYIELALKQDISNIIPKKANVDLNELENIVHSIISEDIFGIEKYMNENTVFTQARLTTYKQIMSLSRQIPSGIEDKENRLFMQLVITEIATNAIFYGAIGVTTTEKEDWDYDFELSLENAIEINWGQDDEKIGVSIIDKGGKLTKKDVLSWITRNLQQDSDGSPINILDSHGRGLYMAREFADTIIINIKKDVCTEIIILNYLNIDCGPSKPLYINEI